MKILTFLFALVTSVALVGSSMAQVSGDITSSELSEILSNLGDFDYDVRSEASRTVRRLAADTIVAPLVTAANSHEDSYVQYRAAVLLYSFGVAEVGAFFRSALDSSNDRVRAAAYDYAEHEPESAIASRLLLAMDEETSEFVRPALIRALAAHGGVADVRARLTREIDQGETYFRGAVIEALGDHGATYAAGQISRIAAERGPLQDDAIIALGKIGGEQALSVFAEAQAKSDDAMLPIISAGACLAGADCPNQVRYVIDALERAAEGASDSPELLRAAATAASVLAFSGRDGTMDVTVPLNALFDTGIAATGEVRGPIALALGSVALRNPQRVQAVLRTRDDLEGSLLLLRDAFDMLDEDMSEERFYMLLRSGYWSEETTEREKHMFQVAMQVLEF